MKRICSLALLLVCLVYAQDSVALPELPPKRFDIQKLSKQEDPHRKIRIIEIPGMGQTVEKWTELITSLAFGTYPPPRAAAGMTHAELLKHCSGLVWNDIDEQDDDVLYEWHVSGCPGEPDQYEIGRIFNSSSTVFKLSYAIKTKKLSDAERTYWIAWMKRARIQLAGSK